MVDDRPVREATGLALIPLAVLALIGMFVWWPICVGALLAYFVIWARGNMRSDGGASEPTPEDPPVRELWRPGS